MCCSVACMGSISPRGAGTYFFSHCLALIFDTLVPEHPEVNCKMAKDRVVKTKPCAGQVGNLQSRKLRICQGHTLSVHAAVSHLQGLL